MKKLYLTCSVLLFVSGLLKAQETELCINLKNGQKQSVRLSTIKSITFKESYVNINSSNPFQLTMSDIKNMTFAKTVGLSEYIKDAPFQIIITDQEIRFPDLNGNKIDLTIFSTNGQIIIARRNWSENILSIAELPANQIYILTVNNTSYKFKK